MKNIYKIGKYYTIIKKRRYYGCYKTLTEAKETRNQLKENNWKTDWKPRKYNKNKTKHKYIQYDKRKNRYYIIKTINYKRNYYGCYKTLTQAIKTRDQLIENNWKTNWKPEPRRKQNNPNKNIHYNKKTRRYIVTKTINNKQDVYGTYRTIKEAKHERNFFEKCDWDWDIIAEQTTGTRSNTGHPYIHRNDNGKYVIQKTSNKKTTQYGTYNTLQEAIYYKDKLERYNWNIQTPTRQHKQDLKYIYKTQTGYCVKKNNNVYNNFRTLEDAQAERDLLIKYDWDYEKLIECADETINGHIIFNNKQVT